MVFVQIKANRMSALNMKLSCRSICVFHRHHSIITTFADLLFCLSVNITSCHFRWLRLWSSSLEIAAGALKNANPVSFTVQDSSLMQHLKHDLDSFFKVENYSMCTKFLGFPKSWSIIFHYASSFWRNVRHFKQLYRLKLSGKSHLRSA